ncbi:hypothetical protein D3C81_1685060 [compost metagenome]
MINDQIVAKPLLNEFIIKNIGAGFNTRQMLLQISHHTSCIVISLAVTIIKSFWITVIIKREHTILQMCLQPNTIFHIEPNYGH